jgi:hypothetical protein
MTKRGAPKKAKASTASKRRAVAAQEKFTADLLARGEASERGADGKVPRHATHVVTRGPGDTVVIKRVRFKTF